MFRKDKLITEMFNTFTSLKGQKRLNASLSDIIEEANIFLTSKSKNNHHRVKFISTSSDFRSFIISFRGKKYYVTHNLISDSYETESIKRLT